MQAPVKKTKETVQPELEQKYPKGIPAEQWNKEVDELLSENEKQINLYNESFNIFKALMLKYRPDDATDELINQKWEVMSEEEFYSLIGGDDVENDFLRKYKSPGEGSSKFRFTAFVTIKEYLEVEADTSEEALEKFHNLDMKKYLQAKNAVQLDKQMEV